MDIEKTCIYGLLYLFLALWMASIIGDVYNSNLRHREQLDANTKNYAANLEQTQALAQALDDSQKNTLQAIAALAEDPALRLSRAVAARALSKPEAAREVAEAILAEANA